MDKIIHVGIMRNSTGYRVFAQHKAFCDKYGEWGVQVTPRMLGETMYEIADWIENKLNLGCLFYVE